MAITETYQFDKTEVTVNFLSHATKWDFEKYVFPKRFKKNGKRMVAESS